MGISIKGAGITIGGIAALWLINKIINVSERTLTRFIDERKWHAYYKFAGISAYSVPPGYAAKMVPHDENNDIKYSSPEEQESENKKNEESEKPVIDISGLVNGFKDIAHKYIDAKFGVPCERNSEPEEDKNNVIEIFGDDKKFVEIEDKEGKDEDE